MKEEKLTQYSDMRLKRRIVLCYIAGEKIMELFAIEKLAIKYCEQYNIEGKTHEVAINAFALDTK